MLVVCWNDLLKISKLAAVGGDDYKSMILDIIKKLLKKDVALLYSTYGKKGKKNFSSLKLYSVITSRL
jgi:hypothetical protein